MVLCHHHGTVDMDTAKVNMCLLLCYILMFSFFFLPCNTLTCRTEGGPKDEELKEIYMNCLKKQEIKNTSETHNFQDDQDWKEPRGQFNQRTQWSRDLRDRDDGMDERDGRMGNRRDRMGGRDDRMSGSGRMDSRGGQRISDDRIGHRDDDGMNNRDSMMGGSSKRDNNNYHMVSKNDGFGAEQINDRYDNPRSDDFDSGMRRYGYHSSTQSPRRFKRSKTNSGQISQYNPNPKPRPEDEEAYGDDDRNSTNSKKELENKACALHCFMKELEMIGDTGMPDRYLVTQGITKDVNDEDLRDFLQESIEECFQVLDNENTEDKCEFSKNLMMCFSEKGRANCDDWKEDIKF